MVAKDVEGRKRERKEQREKKGLKCDRYMH